MAQLEHCSNDFLYSSAFSKIHDIGKSLQRQLLQKDNDALTRNYKEIGQRIFLLNTKVRAGKSPTTIPEVEDIIEVIKQKVFDLPGATDWEILKGASEITKMLDDLRATDGYSKQAPASGIAVTIEAATKEGVPINFPPSNRPPQRPSLSISPTPPIAAIKKENESLMVTGQAVSLNGAPSTKSKKQYRVTIDLISDDEEDPGPSEQMMEKLQQIRVDPVKDVVEERSRGISCFLVPMTSTLSTQPSQHTSQIYNVLSSSPCPAKRDAQALPAAKTKTKPVEDVITASMNGAPRVSSEYAYKVLQSTAEINEVVSRKSSAKDVPRPEAATTINAKDIVEHHSTASLTTPQHPATEQQQSLPQEAHVDTAGEAGPSSGELSLYAGTVEPEDGEWNEEIKIEEAETTSTPQSKSDFEAQDGEINDHGLPSATERRSLIPISRQQNESLLLLELVSRLIGQSCGMKFKQFLKQKITS